MPNITLDELKLHSGSLASFNFDPPKMDLTLRDVVVADGWITGTAEIDAWAFGGHLGQQSVPFKTKDNVAEEIEIVGAKLTIKAHLADPHKVCADGSLSWGPFSAHTGEQCVAV